MTKDSFSGISGQFFFRRMSDRCKKARGAGAHGCAAGACYRSFTSAATNEIQNMQYAITGFISIKT